MARLLPGLFAPPGIRRAPVAPMQRRLLRPMFGARPRPPAQEGPFAPSARYPFEAGPPPPPAPVPGPMIGEEFDEEGRQPYDPRRTAALTRQFQAENVVFARAGPERPVVGALPQVGVQPERPSGRYWYVLGGKTYYTDSPNPIKPERAKDGKFYFFPPGWKAGEPADTAEPGQTITPRSIMETNPAFTRAYATLSPQERDIFAGRPFAAEGEEGAGAGATIEDVPGLPGYKWIVPRDEFGNRGQPGTPFIPRNLEEEREKLGREREKAEREYAEAAVERSADRRLRRQQFDYQVALAQWKHKENLARIYGERKAERGGYAAQAAPFAPVDVEAASERAYQEAVRGGYAGTAFTAASIPSQATIARGYDPNAPPGSPANPYGAGAFTPSGAPRQTSPAFVQNLFATQPENARLVNVSNANVSAQRIREAAKDPAKLQTLLEGMGPQGVAQLRAVLSQYDEDGTFMDVLRMLEAGSRPGAFAPPRMATIRWAGVR